MVLLPAAVAQAAAAAAAQPQRVLQAQQDKAMQEGLLLRHKVLMARVVVAVVQGVQARMVPVAMAAQVAMARPVASKVRPYMPAAAGVVP